MYFLVVLNVILGIANLFFPTTFNRVVAILGFTAAAALFFLLQCDKKKHMETVINESQN